MPHSAAARSGCRYLGDFCQVLTTRSEPASVTTPRCWCRSLWRHVEAPGGGARAVAPAWIITPTGDMVHRVLELELPAEGSARADQSDHADEQQVEARDSTGGEMLAG